jgi:hypothetical protein
VVTTRGSSNLGRSACSTAEPTPEKHNKQITIKNRQIPLLITNLLFNTLDILLILFSRYSRGILPLENP